ncbi:NADP-dependent oxidoreductase [Veronia pacifica]|uniref:NADP-dependent oxidoreductase n=2 Tax=Veronia pacifica TaxID=1080227 RepID=A0A1C3ESA6_9GAMM|nr:NADP-dependent oxidoreductase [Veronia pacifica]ODA36088.1 NADP-dependent oxidoreductase [Veronia pacifica]
MSQTPSTNRQMTLAARPFGAPTDEHFALVDTDVPTPSNGQVLLRTLYLSVDPYMRGRMNDAESYADPVPLGGVMVGGTVSKVQISKNDDFKEGDWVLSFAGWQDYALSDGTGLIKLDPARMPPSYALGVMGMPGFTAYMGLMDIGQPKAGETLVVAAATGAVGSMVAQIGKLQGCRVVGIAGGEEKCRYALDTLKLDACIDHKSEHFAAELAEACPAGIDIYFENVGGKVFDAVMPLLNTRARIPLCGLISQYNRTELPQGPDRLSQLAGLLLVKRITMRGFIIMDDYGHRYPEFAQQMGQWLAEGKITYKEQRVEGLEQAPQALIDVLEGKNFGKVVVEVAKD